VSARTLAPAWFFPTGDAVTANPIVVGSTVYVGSWDGHFYALDRVTGKPRWNFQIAPQSAAKVKPQPYTAIRPDQHTKHREQCTSGDRLFDALRCQCANQRPKHQPPHQ